MQFSVEILTVLPKACLTVGLLLLIGDFVSTFVYHVPEHAFGRLHCRVHHENGTIVFGDIFTIFDEPAQQWLKRLTQLKKKLRRT